MVTLTRFSLRALCDPAVDPAMPNLRTPDLVVDPHALSTVTKHLVRFGDNSVRKMPGAAIGRMGLVVPGIQSGAYS